MTAAYRLLSADARAHGYFEVADALDDLLSVPGRIADLILGLGEVYTREGVHIWLTGRHKLLDNRVPLDVMREPGGAEPLCGKLEVVPGRVKLPPEYYPAAMPSIQTLREAVAEAKEVLGV